MMKRYTRHDAIGTATEEECMKDMILKLTLEELRLLATLASDQVNNRMAAYMLAIDRVAFAIRLRGLYA